MNRSGRSNFISHAIQVSACAMVSVWLLSGCDANRSSSDISQTATRLPMLVNTIRLVEVQDSRKTEVGFGKLKPNQPARLSFVRPGQVKTVLKQAGDSCLEGEPLAVLAQPQLEQQKESLAARLTKLKQNPQASQQVAETTVQLKQIEAQLVAGTIKAPYDGVVIECNVNQNSQTSPAATAFIVAQSSVPFIEINLPNDVVSQLQPDQKTWAAIGDKAIVSKVKNQAAKEASASSQKLQLEFVDELPEDAWAFGDVVEIRFYLRTEESGFWVPLSALQREPAGQWTVDAVITVDGPPVIERRTIEVVQLEDEFALVQGNLADGDEIVAEGGHRIVAGQKVTAVDVSKKFSLPFRKGVTE